VHYLLFYEVGNDYVARRAEFRNAHLQKAWAAAGRGELVLGGALANPLDGALLLFKGTSSEVAEKFARADPYVTSGIVKRWYVREWTTVAGEDATTPVTPDSARSPGKPQCEPAKADTGSRPSSKRASASEPSREQLPILRMWKARSTAENAGAYVQHATREVFPRLRSIAGHRGSYLLRRVAGDATELVVMTVWDSMDAVRTFAGAQPDQAVVDPEVRAVLSSCDELVTHFEVILGIQ